jgi:hypothetical protein
VISKKENITKIENPTNACITISSNYGKIIIDPWFEDGIYDGGWHNFPRISESYQAQILESATTCLITHLHKDHFNIHTLNKLAKDTKFIFPKTFGWQVIKSNLEANGFKNTHLLDLSGETITSEGFAIQAIPPLNTVGLEDESCENGLSIDGGFVLTSNYSDLKLVFLADNNPYNEEMIDKNLHLLNEPDLIAFAYSGFASDYPFNYLMSEEEKVNICKDNEEVRFNKQVKNIEKIKPKFILPYSSEFVPVNEYCETWSRIYKRVFTSDKSFVAKRYGTHLGCKYGTLYPNEFLEFNNNTLIPITETYPRSNMLDEMLFYQDMIKSQNTKSNKESLEECIDINAINDLLKDAAENCFSAVKRFNLSPKFVINLFIDKHFFSSINFSLMAVKQKEDNSNSFLNIYLDLDMAYKLLGGALHWDDGILSMKIRWLREPNIFCFDTYNALTYLCLPFFKTKEIAHKKKSSVK